MCVDSLRACLLCLVLGPSCVWLHDYLASCEVLLLKVYFVLVLFRLSINSLPPRVLDGRVSHTRTHTHISVYLHFKRCVSGCHNGPLSAPRVSILHNWLLLLRVPYRVKTESPLPCTCYPTLSEEACCQIWSYFQRPHLSFMSKFIILAHYLCMDCVCACVRACVCRSLCKPREVWVHM